MFSSRKSALRLWSCWSAAALDAHGRDAYADRTFAQRSDGEQDRIIAGMESGSLRLPEVSAAPFFETLLQDTRNGFFAGPIYGGNRDMAAWKMIGFPAPAAIIATGSSGIMRATPTAGQHCRTQCMVPTTAETVVSNGRFAARLTAACSAARRRPSFGARTGRSSPTAVLR
jgi:gluconate 2-dehydrogenase subunit 3-like protein